MLADEIYLLSKHGNLGSVNDIENMATWKRRYFLHKLETEVNAQQDETNRMKAKSGHG